MATPATLPADFNGWDDSASHTIITLPSGKKVHLEHTNGAPTSLPADFNNWDSPLGTPAEQDFLQNNPDYTYVPKDPSRPNTQEGIYKKSEAVTMAKDPTMEHHPVDLDFGKHTAEYGAGSAAAIGGLAAGAPAIGAAAEGAVNKVLDPNTWKNAGKTIVT